MEFLAKVQKYLKTNRHESIHPMFDIDCSRLKYTQSPTIKQISTMCMLLFKSINKSSKG
jgi:hypothetical protein